MAPKIQQRKGPDVGWQHGEMIGGNRLHTRCNYCQKELRGGGVTRLKHHLAGGNPNVEKCYCCPVEVSRAMNEHPRAARKEKEEITMERDALRDRLAGKAARMDRGKGICVDDDFSDDDSDREDVITREEREHLDEAMRRSIADIHYKEQGGRRSVDFVDVGCTPGRASSGGRRHGAGLIRSTSVREAFDKMVGRSKQPKKKSKGSTIEEMDPSIYRNRDAKQIRLKDSWHPGKWAKNVKQAIGRWFIYSNIAPNAANNPYYQTMIDEIARAGLGIKGPTPYEITGPILDAEVDEMQTYIKSFMKKWDTYGVTLMCDGWTGPTKLSIINFLVYCDGRAIFHKSVNASDKIKDHEYLFKLMDEVVEEIGEKYIIQIVTDNQSSYKKVGELLMEKRKHLYWTPCAAHCIDLMLHDFGQKKQVKGVIEKARRLTNFVYNHNWVLSLMREHTKGELLRPGLTRFATNFIAINSIMSEKAGLRRMFLSDQWQECRQRRDVIGKKVEDIVLSNTFWKNGRLVAEIHDPLVKVLRVMDGEKQATIGYLYEAIRRSKLAIAEAAPADQEMYCAIIDKRCKKQLIQDIHRAAFYLHSAYHYTENLGDDTELVSSFRRVMLRLERDPKRVSKALSEEKTFRDAMYGFGDPAAIRARTTCEPAEWWFLYGTDASNLRRIALRLLSQTASSSGCERNWSTFSLIHTKVRNRLSYAKLEKLVFVHYNMRLKIRHLQKQSRRGEGEFRPIDLAHIFDEDADELLTEWLDNPEEVVLDELDDEGRPTRPSSYVANLVNRFSDDEGGGNTRAVGSSRAGVSSSSTRVGRDPPDDDDDDDDDGDDGDENDDDDDVGRRESPSSPPSPPQGGTGSGYGGGIHITEEAEEQQQQYDHGSGHRGHPPSIHNLYHRKRRGGHPAPGSEHDDVMMPLEHNFDAITQGIDLINVGLSGIFGGRPNSGSRSSSFGRTQERSSSSYDYGYGQGGSSYQSSYGYGYEHTGYGYGQEGSSSYGQQMDQYGHYGGNVGGYYRPTSAQYQQFRREYEAWYRNYMDWASYCQHVQRTHNVPLADYEEAEDEPARHSFWH